MPSKHLTEYNTLRDNALHFTRKLNTNQQTETLVRRRAFSVTDAMPVCDAILVPTISPMLRAATAAVIIILNVRC